MKKGAEILRRAGLKVTSIRVAVLQVLLHEHGPFTLEELYARMPRPKCDLVTMYRTVASFQKHGILQRCDFGDGPIRFELRQEGEAHHHHVVCTECRRVRVLDDCFVEQIETALKKQGYTAITHNLEFFAVCAQCTKPGRNE